MAEESAWMSFPEDLPSGWRQQLASEKEKEYFGALVSFLNQEARSGATVFPAPENVLRALRCLDLADVRVVILGQDPYHGPGQATGLSFAVPNEVTPKPPSLLNIFREIREDLGVELDERQSDLSGWVEQGVLLLNSVLTVRAREAFSHRSAGWEQFTDSALRVLGERPDPVVFLLWGSAAQSKASLLERGRHFVLRAPHPSPLSAYRGFFGCRHFSRCNRILEKLGFPPIRWERLVAQGNGNSLTSSGSMRPAITA